MATHSNILARKSASWTCLKFEKSVCVLSPCPKLCSVLEFSLLHYYSVMLYLFLVVSEYFA